MSDTTNDSQPIMTGRGLQVKGAVSGDITRRPLILSSHVCYRLGGSEHSVIIERRTLVYSWGNDFHLWGVISL